MRHSTDTNNAVRFNYTMCFCELVEPLELFYLRTKVFSTRALIFDGEVGAIISKFMSGRQAPEPIKMISHIKSHGSHVLTLCHEVAQKKKTIFYFCQLGVRGNKSKK
jgi:hypothetical protein